MNGYVIGLVILIVLVLAASAAASVIWDIDYKRQVSGKRQFHKLKPSILPFHFKITIWF